MMQKIIKNDMIFSMINLRTKKFFNTLMQGKWNDF